LRTSLTRQCGACQLCCKLVPVRELNKKAGERCRHQRVGKGCMIYAHRPASCFWWNCRWLVNDDTAGLPRPDRSHYVIDLMPDIITMQEDLTGKLTQIPVVQIWVDPDFPEAHRDPALRAYVERRAAEGVAALIRFSEREGFALFAPALADDHQWHEKASNYAPRHS
jgi:hypothetical protein